MSVDEKANHPSTKQLWVEGGIQTYTMEVQMVH